MSSIDDRINEAWCKLKTSHNQEHTLTIEARSLEKLIADQSNSEELQKELKDLVMKWYWNGYYQGFDDNNLKSK
ncbi:uncharacterized protein AC631_01320 [Debaryomyces fabryi]|uniref:Uncharacterized protein n=1 Tax=Debaryomyces fabryi TaxID=58627 RepID=A0A0V1Q342_9ASCO|nr:uncharacterized protein AC631_01320 [Debaryomyces fabryi]KSA02955.1 hypothetical protein AC631_01320 [Debaryomyces fabryi]CUM50918.1 unnamed protein product [Debaryomyces fabryi]